MTGYAFFPGCKVAFEMPELERKIRDTLEYLNVDVVDVGGLSCCPGYDSIMSFDSTASLAITARNFSIVEEQNLDILTPCSECFSVFKYAISRLEDEKTFLDVNSKLAKIGRIYRGKIRVLHITDVYYDEIVKKNPKTAKLGLKAGIHTGCHLLYTEKSSEYLEKIKRILNKIGVSTEKYSREDYYCGKGSISLLSPESSAEFTERLIESLDAETDVDAIVAACPHCYDQIKTAQDSLLGRGKISKRYDVYHISELVWMAMRPGERT
ncbi:heterodisulfide reductase-related iron-sulfur binding cluster [Geoglobus acetivorans]|uniref:CoB--CoM heterodisulfide reductase subunit B n=1 Tax=Geoglobus acetivorans TaxID=565033 RepID=A0A0A7GCM5_GEOAI|nr:CoB--CoM heterodisulfide reductase subunit B [Geoglobus acetivorans]